MYLGADRLSFYIKWPLGELATTYWQEPGQSAADFWRQVKLDMLRFGMKPEPGVTVEEQAGYESAQAGWNGDTDLLEYWSGELGLPYTRPAPASPVEGSDVVYLGAAGAVVSDSQVDSLIDRLGLSPENREYYRANAQRLAELYGADFERLYSDRALANILLGNAGTTDPDYVNNFYGGVVGSSVYTGRIDTLLETAPLNVSAPSEPDPGFILAPTGSSGETGDEGHDLPPGDEETGDEGSGEGAKLSSKTRTLLILGAVGLGLWAMSKR